MAEHAPILLVDDDRNDCELTLRELAELHLGNQLIALRDGEAALDYLRVSAQAGQLPVVVLLDVRMPKVDGIAVLREVRTDPRLSSLKVLLLLSTPGEEAVLVAYPLRADGYLIKPVSAGGFKRAIERLGLSGELAWPSRLAGA